MTQDVLLPDETESTGIDDQKQFEDLSDKARLILTREDLSDRGMDRVKDMIEENGIDGVEGELFARIQIGDIEGAIKYGKDRFDINASVDEAMN